MGDEKEKEGGTGPSLREQVAELVKEMTSGGGEKKKEPAGDIESQVEKAVERVRSGDEAARRRSELEARLAALEEKKPPEQEKKPKVYRRITALMWGGDDDGE